MNIPTNQKLLLSIKEAAGLIGVGATKAYQIINAGHLNTRRIGGRSLIARKDVEALAENVASGTIDLSHLRAKRSEAA